jgi:AcrR family transcriptional regulator
MDQTVYAKMRAEGKELQRRMTLEVAGELLIGQGPEALTMRAVAKRLGTSTSVLYTMFGGKDGLAEGLFVEGFQRLQRAFDTVPSDLDPTERLLALGQAYFSHAVENPNYYGIMFLNVLPGFAPSAAAFGVGSRTFGVFEMAVARCLETGVFPGGNVRELTLALWSAGHGVASLHLAGRIRNPETFQPDAAHLRRSRRWNPGRSPG